MTISIFPEGEGSNNWLAFPLFSERPMGMGAAAGGKGRDAPPPPPRLKMLGNVPSEIVIFEVVF